MILIMVVYRAHFAKPYPQLYLEACSSKLVPWFPPSLDEEFGRVSFSLKKVLKLQNRILDKLLKGLCDTSEAIFQEVTKSK